jgi:taurine dioxygenase
MNPAVKDEAQGALDGIYRESPLAVRPLTPIFGAEVTGATSIQGNPAWLAKVLNQLWCQYGILLFRDVEFDEAGEVAFSRMFGELEIHGRHDFNAKDHPQLLYVTNRKDLGLPADALSNDDLEWHTDQTYLPRPALGSLLFAIEVPAEGGDTYWADAAAAYDRLPKATKQKIAPLKAVHDHGKVTAAYGVKASAFQRKRSARIEAHPIVRTHPVTLRKSLYLAPTVVTHIEGLTASQSDALLEELTAAMTSTELIYRHKWRAGDGVLWDNARVIHRRDRFPADSIRFMRRTTIRPPAEISIPF